jgi:peptide/nickel transport system permease protein
MGTYILRRILINIPVLLLVTMLIFILVEIAPGDMADYFITDESLQYLNAADIEALRESLGLNDAPPIRYFKWLGRIIRGDLGFSFIEKENVNQLLLRRMGNSSYLMFFAFVISLAIGIPVGIFIALRQYSIADFTITGLSFVAISMPSFVAGILGIYFFAVKLPIFPAGGMYRALGNRSFGDLLYHLVLPGTTLALMHLARNIRYTRISMLDVLKQDYIVTARAKGLGRNATIYKHALRNALIPIVTIVGIVFTQLIVGAVYMETIYNWPGLGRLYYNAINSRDYPVIMGANLVIALLVLTVNLLVDILYSVIDPRIRYK